MKQTGGVVIIDLLHVQPGCVSNAVDSSQEGGDDGVGLSGLRVVLS